MRGRDRRFRGHATYYAHGMKWTRSFNRASGDLSWRWQKGGLRMLIRRNRFGSYYVMGAGVFHGPYTRLTEAFKVAAGIPWRK